MNAIVEGVGADSAGVDMTSIEFVGTNHNTLSRDECVASDLKKIIEKVTSIFLKLENS